VSASAIEAINILCKMTGGGLGLGLGLCEEKQKENRRINWIVI